MRVKTIDGQIFDVPEENLESFLSEYNTAMNFEKANVALDEAGAILNRRGDNWAGAARNFLQGLPGAARAEADIRSDEAMTRGLAKRINAMLEEERNALRNNPNLIRDLSKSTKEDLYRQYKQNAFESAAGYAAVHPETATALTIAGALAPSLSAYLLTPVTGGASAAAGTANLARAAATGANVARRTHPVIRALRTGGIGGGLGATYGFMNDPSEDLGERLASAGTGVAVGGVLGTGGTLGLSLLGGGKNLLTRTIRGIPRSSLPANQVEDFVLNSGVLQNTPEQNVVAGYLNKAAEYGARDIYDPLYMLNETLEASKNLRKPGILTNLTGETPAAQRIIDAARTPQMDLAAERYANFVSSVKDTPGQGLVATEFLKRNPVAEKILAVEPSLKDVPVGSFEWWKNAESTLNNSLPKNLDTSRAIGRRASILNSIDDMSATREIIHPGTTAANTDYAIGKAWQERGNEVARQRLRQMAAQPKEEPWSASSKGLLSHPMAAWYRGRARELIKNGALYNGPAQSLENVANAEVQAIINGLRIIGDELQ